MDAGNEHVLGGVEVGPKYCTNSGYIKDAPGYVVMVVVVQAAVGGHECKVMGTVVAPALYGCCTCSF